MKSLQQSQPTTELQLKEHSTGLIVTLTNPDAARDFERSLTLSKVLESAVPMREVGRVVGMRQVAIAIDIQLTRLIASLNLKWNITDAQVKTIVEDIMDKYPNESIEDFILCFKKARQGEYGELYRLDSAVVFVWIQRYLDEKYLALEDELNKLKTNDYHERPAKTDEGPGYKLFKEYVKKMTDKYGDEVEPRKKVTDGYKYFSVRNVKVMALNQEHAEELVELMIQRGDLIEDK